MFLQIAIIVTTIKVFFIPFYYSTDFEVHRNWLAVTHNLTIDQWYYDNTSEWTLDYPPFFAWLEYGLSHVAKLFDPKMLYLTNLNYNSNMTVLFQRLSVIVLDLVYILAVRSCSKLISNGRLFVYMLLVTNAGLLMVDHIHFQYNGFLYGILLLSISHMIKSNFIQAALWFAVLLNLKHIFLYIAPAYIVYLLRAYCFMVSSEDGLHTPWYSFSIMNLIKLACTVIVVFGLSFGPFLDHIPQIIARLFPFKRGLSHAYWAPNFWALYNFADKVFQVAFTRAGVIKAQPQASMTGGLVQEYQHAVLPSVTPTVTFALTFVMMVPALIKLWNLCADERYRALSFIRCMIICASCSFIFGWHVHEKAILMIIIPLSFMSVLGVEDGITYLMISTVGHYSLFPLLYPKSLVSIKLFILLSHCGIGFSTIPFLYIAKPKKRKRFLRLSLLTDAETVYLYGLIALFVYENMIHTVWGLNKTLPFLPLMFTSVYCALGVIYYWIYYYYYFLTFNLSGVPTVGVVNLNRYEKKIH
ncbi:probable dolichyl pyrophosphate Glc1Man9GlcNAc2 alpha-1,3-glucosyltransferase [Ostrinia nubilalis]|uniref:probable dolichyl pyrophosphate Glc1Man9GlcNAc2 alpha-1,3-glucosyltransferase n=1 Tax=Ostrinia nubilalis TaxID=29057 RepID=UPI003082695A